MNTLLLRIGSILTFESGNTEVVTKVDSDSIYTTNEKETERTHNEKEIRVQIYKGLTTVRNVFGHVNNKDNE